ncbi:MAG: PIG-L family deacetylase [Rhodocyclaceae bacterium]|nr:PIG-L family deacetylase [Rhodocyclaceae bacterium]
MTESKDSPKNILVFGAHPDDVEIGMAGTVCRLAACGHHVYSVIATIPDEREMRLREAREAARILGIKEVIVLPLRASQLGYNRSTIGAIDLVIRQFAPHSVFTHWNEDSHQDHVNVTRCIIAATRKNSFNVYMYEQTIPGGITPAGFRAQYLVDISRFIDHKVASIEAHASQIRRNGEWWSEGVRGRAMYRGYQIRTRYAEAFEIIKINGDTNLFANEDHTAAPVAEAAAPRAVLGLAAQPPA